MLTSLIDKSILPTGLHFLPQSNEHDVSTRTIFFTDELLEKELSDSLQLKEEQKKPLTNCGKKKGCFGNSSYWIWAKFDFPKSSTRH